MPVLPTRLPEINRIAKLIADPCGPSPAIWFSLAVPAAVRAATTILDPFNWKTEVKLATGKSWLKQLKIYAADAHVDLPTTQAALLDGLFELAEVVDMATWYTFLFGVAVEGLMDWTSMVYQFTGCDAAARAGYSAITQPQLLFVGDGDWHAAGVWAQYAPRVINPAAPVINQPANKTAFINVALRVRNQITFQPIPFDMRLVDLRGNIVAVQSVTADDLHHSNAGALLVGFPVEAHPTGNQYQIQVRAETGTFCGFISGRAACIPDLSGFGPFRPHKYKFPHLHGYSRHRLPHHKRKRHKPE